MITKKSKAAFLLLRPQQWIKNLFVYMPLFFNGHVFEIDYLIPCSVAFVSFCLAASGVYCINDICDLPQDRLHPEKSKRILVSGAISVRSAYLLALTCFLCSIGVCFVLKDYAIATRLAVIILSYQAMNIAYYLKLKQIAIVDVFIISMGFVLRIIAGGMSTQIELTHWIILMTFLLALFLAIAKRRDDVIIYEKTGHKMRKNITRYNLSFINQVLSVIASITIVCYIMYVVSPEVIERFKTSYLYVTTVFVLAGIVRYLQLTTVDTSSGDPSRVVLKDTFILLCVLGWITMFLIIIYI